MTASPVRAWRLHLGAHKTATTHLQDTLRHHRKDLQTQGLDYIPRPEFRRLIHRFSRPGSWRHHTWPLAKFEFDRRLAALHQDADTVLASDEDLLGYSYDLLTVPIYASPKALHLVRHLARSGETELFLSIRSFDQILPSAYAQTLKSVPRIPGSMAQIRQALRDDPPSWVELINRIQRAVPEARLRVWCQEDYRMHWRALLNAYAGRDLGQLTDLPPPLRTVSPSPEAIVQAEQMDTSLPRKERSAKVRALYAKLPAGDKYGHYAPLKEEDISILKEAYTHDLQEIESRYPGMLMTPGNDFGTEN